MEETHKFGPLRNSINFSPFSKENENNQKEKIIKLFESHLQFSISYETDKEYPDILNDRWFSPIDRSLRRELKSKNFNYWFDTSKYKNLIDLRIKYKD